MKGSLTTRRSSAGARRRRPDDLAGLAPETLRALYVTMRRIRRAEETIVALYPEQEIRCPTHLSIGQEAAAAGVCQALRPTDTAVSTHRCHAHYLAKGGDLRGMFAELYGKATGCCGGKGGSMHLTDVSVGAYGSIATVGAHLPIAVGIGFAASYSGSDDVCLCFRVSLRKIRGYLKREDPPVASLISELDRAEANVVQSNARVKRLSTEYERAQTLRSRGRKRRARRLWQQRSAAGSDWADC